MKDMIKERPYLIFLVIIIVQISIIAFLTNGFENLTTYSQNDLTNIIPKIIFIFIVIERTNEIIVSSLRNNKAIKLKIMAERELAQRCDRSKVLQAGEDDKETNYLAFKSNSRQMALWIGVVLGVFLSIIGVRFIENIFLLNQSFIGGQRGFIRLLDILFSSAVLSGGAELVHKVILVFESLNNKITKMLKNTKKLYP